MFVLLVVALLMARLPQIRKDFLIIKDLVSVSVEQRKDPDFLLPMYIEGSLRWSKRPLWLQHFEL